MWKQFVEKMIIESYKETMNGNKDCDQFTRE